MVMETLSPQNVGREFVRQYYTMLNKAPLHLHRFYTQDSSFVHGGIDQPGQETQPVFGQQEIHKKIMQLNFRDCHAKIRQVDSHATMEDGVVVQVTGELSNNGQPMRRFMQTFVLASQSPKRYYVRNDIFRYQDEIFQEEDENEVVESAPESEPEEDQPDVVDSSESLQDHTYFEQATVSNGSAHIDEIAVMTSPTVQPNTTPPSLAQVTPPPQTHMESIVNDVEKFEPTTSDSEIYEGKAEEKSPEPSDDPGLQYQQPPDSPNEPKTYANMVSKNASSASSGSTGSGSAASWHSAGTSKLTPTPPIPNHLPYAGNSRGETKNDGFMASQNTVSQPQRMQRSRGNSLRGGMRDRGMRINDDGADGDRRRSTPPYPDNQQLFVGNLPHTITEDDLKDQFSKYGNVVDIRINNRPSPKPGTRVPNFGFVTFEDPSSVTRVLGDKPIKFQGEHRLNVEEKKTRPRDQQRTGGGDGRPNSGRGGGIGSRMGMGISRGGGRGGGPGSMNRSDNRGGGGNIGNRGGGFGQGQRR